VTWNPRAYGTASDPVRQSDLSDIASAYGCSKRFQLRKEAEAAGEELRRETASGRMVVGSAVHGTIHRYLTRASHRILGSGDTPSHEAIRVVLIEELDRAREGRPIEWYGDDRQAEITNATHMVHGALRTLADRASSIVLAEAPFRATIDGGNGQAYHVVGTVDLVYRTRDGELALADWKTGAQRLPQIILDHGYQLGIYAHALAEGTFRVAGEDRRIEQFPSELYVVHLRDFVPYAKASSKVVDRPEECAFYGVERGTKVKTKAGDLRGPGWYRAHRTEADVARLRHSIRKLVSGVRLGVLFEHVDEHCGRCPFKARCLADGHAVDGAERARLEAALRGVDLGGTDDDIAA
jgi:hypothetical protein